MKHLFFVILLATISACGQQTIAQPTETPIPIVVSPTSVPTSTLLPVTVTPSPLPPSPTLPIFTPEQEVLKDIIKSYFDHRYLALNTFQLDGFGELVSNAPDAKIFLDAELDKLGVQIKHTRLNNLRYAYYKYFLEYHNIVVDNSNRTVTISLVEGNDVIHEISMILDPEDPIVSHMSGIEHTIILRKEQGQWKIISDYYNDYLWRILRKPGTSIYEMLKNIKAVPLPSQSTSIAITSNLTQLERWMEYENVLAKKLLPLSHPEEVICEWELLGRSNQDEYVWAVCTEIGPAVEISPFFFRTASIPVVIHLGANGAIQNTEIPKYGSGYLSDVRRLLPLYAQKIIADLGKMEEHLDLRRTHPTDPPLIVLSSTSTP